MRAIHTFTVATDVPAELEPLQRLGRNLSWLTHERVIELFDRVAPNRSDTVHPQAAEKRDRG